MYDPKAQSEQSRRNYYLGNLVIRLVIAAIACAVFTAFIWRFQYSMVCVDRINGIWEPAGMMLVLKIAIPAWVLIGGFVFFVTRP